MTPGAITVTSTNFRFSRRPLGAPDSRRRLPDGAVIRDEPQRLAKDLARADGCQSVYTPCSSGHCSSAPATGEFSDDMFPPMPVGGDSWRCGPQPPASRLIYASGAAVLDRDPPIRLE